MRSLDVVAVGELWGNACGALTASRPGGSGAFSNRADVEAFIRARHEF